MLKMLAYQKSDLKCNIVDACNITLEYEDKANGERVEILHTNISQIKMGEVGINETSFRNLYMTNCGNHCVMFHWNLTSTSCDALDYFSLEPQVNQINPGERKSFILRYVARLEKLTSCSLKLIIKNGPVYNISVDGIAVKPVLNFLPQELNFGKRFTLTSSNSILAITNRGEKDANIFCLSKPSSQSAFDYEIKEVKLDGQKSFQYSIRFLPREAKLYKEKLVFKLNDLTEKEILLTGYGVEPGNEHFDLGQTGNVHFYNICCLA